MPIDQLLPEELIAVLYVLSLPLDKVRLLHSKGKEPKPRLGPNEIQRFLNAVRRRKMDYATGIDEDRSLLASLEHAPSRRRQALAIRVRIGEKEVLVHLEHALQTYLDEQQATSSTGQTRRGHDEDSEVQNKRRKL